MATVTWGFCISQTFAPGFFIQNVFNTYLKISEACCSKITKLWKRLDFATQASVMTSGCRTVTAVSSPPNFPVVTKRRQNPEWCTVLSRDQGLPSCLCPRQNRHLPTLLSEVWTVAVTEFGYFPWCKGKHSHVMLLNEASLSDQTWDLFFPFVTFQPYPASLIVSRYSSYHWF